MHKNQTLNNPGPVESNFTSRYGYRKVKLNARNVGLLLQGTPPALIDSIEDDPEWDVLKTKDPWDQRVLSRLRKEAVARRRDSIIERLVGRYGWMDHGEIYSRSGVPTALVGHPYQVNADDMARIAAICSIWGLSAYITQTSWYSSGTSLVHLFRG